MARKYRHFVYDEKQRFVYPTSDWGFKHILGTERNKDLLLGILRELLPDMEIESLEFMPRDITIPVGTMKDARFDVFCKMKNGTVAVIEMQNYANKSFLDRSLIYSSAAILEHYVNSSSKNYRIGKTIFLAFLGDPIFTKVKRTPIRLSLCDIDEPLTVIINDKLLQIYVELPKFTGSLEQMDENTPFIEKLAYVLMEMADCDEIPEGLNDPLLEGMFQAADRFTMGADMQEDYMKAILGEAEYEYRIESAVEEAREQGIEQGIEKGHRLGVEEANAANEARLSKIREKLSELGLSPEVIQEITSNAE